MAVDRLLRAWLCSIAFLSTALPALPAFAQLLADPRLPWQSAETPHFRVHYRAAQRAQAEAVNAAPRQYLNRLSDLLFVLARVLNRANLDGLGGDDVYWRSERLQRQQG